MYKVHFINRPQAKTLEPSEREVMISIYTPGDSPVSFNLGKKKWGAVFCLSFFDVDAASEGLIYQSISKDQAKLLFSFIKEKVEEGYNKFWVHCDAGISRSAGVAKFIAEYVNAPFNHNYSLYNKNVYKRLKEAQNEDEYNVES